MDCDNFHFDQPQGVFRTTPCVQYCGAKVSGILRTNVKRENSFPLIYDFQPGKINQLPLDRRYWFTVTF
jgi:hypothetical protein